MLKVKLTPDDVLKGAGGYRDVVEMDCPVCGEGVVYETESRIRTTECGGCGEEFGVEEPFH